MGGIRTYDVFGRIGVQADRLTKAVSFIDVVLRKDGMNLVTSKESTKLDTEHRFRGNAYRILNQRNAEEGSLLTYFWPNSVKTFLDAVFSETDGMVPYHNWEWYWDATLNSVAGNQDVGADYQGLAFNGISFSIERGNTGNSVEVDLRAFTNAKENFAYTVTRPTFTRSPQEPYGSTDFLIDFQGDVSIDNYGKDNPHVRSISFNFTNNIELRNFRASVVAKLDKSWTEHFIQEPALTVEVELEVADDNYLRYDEGAQLVEGALRIVGRHPDASLKTTSTETLTAGAAGTEVITVASAVGAAVADVILFIHPTTGHFAVLPIASIASNDLSFNRDLYDSYVTINGSVGGPLTVENMAFMIHVPRMTLVKSTPPKSNGSVRTISLSYEADLLAGETAIVERLAYNHSAAHP